MRYRTICLFLAAMVAACTGPGTDSGPAAGASAGSGAAPAGGGWVTLFDGSNLDAFTQTGDANWRIEGNTVRADSGSGMLVTKESYRDFAIDLEFWVDVPANSGVFIRCSDPQNIGATNCYEVNIFDTRPDQTYRTGAIVNVASPKVVLNTGGRWNRYEIMAQGDHFHIVLNGEVTVDADDSQFGEGHIGLQYGAGTVIFRNVRIRSL